MSAPIAFIQGTELRMLQKADKEGVRLYFNLREKAWFATSGTSKEKRYRVSPIWCECAGFAKHGYCKHWALCRARVAEAAEADTDDEPTPPATPALRILADPEDGDTDDGEYLAQLAIEAARLTGEDDDAYGREIVETIRRLAVEWCKCARRPGANLELVYACEFILTAALRDYRLLLEEGVPAGRHAA